MPLPVLDSSEVRETRVIARSRTRVLALVERAQKTLPARVVTAYGESQATNYALALAFAGFMAMFPMILGALSIIGLAIRDPQTESHFQLLILQLFPGSAQPELQKAITGVKESAGWLGLVSLGGLLWSATSTFSTLEFALTEIFGTRQRNMIKQRLMGIATMLLLVVAIVALVGLNAGLTFVPIAPWARWVIGFAAGAVVLVGLLTAMYRFVPHRSFRIGEVLPGAILAGVLIEVLSLAFPLYARVAGGFNTYGAEFALFFVLATWFYLLSQLLLLGAVFNKVRIDRAAAKRDAAPSPEAKEASEAAPTGPRRSIFQRAALAGVVAVALAVGVVRRKRPKT